MTMERIQNMDDIWNRNPAALLGHLHLCVHGPNAASESRVELEGARSFFDT